VRIVFFVPVSLFVPVSRRDGTFAGFTIEPAYEGR
jgi:hypothetical protein